MGNILESTYQGSSQRSEFEAHTLNIEVLDVPGVLNQVGAFGSALHEIVHGAGHETKACAWRAQPGCCMRKSMKQRTAPGVLSQRGKQHYIEASLK